MGLSHTHVGHVEESSGSLSTLTKSPTRRVKKSLGEKRTEIPLLRATKATSQRMPSLAKRMRRTSWPALDLSSSMPLKMRRSHAAAPSVRKPFTLDKKITSAVNVGKLLAP